MIKKERAHFSSTFISSSPPFFKINLIPTAPARPAHRPEIYPPKRLVLLSTARPTSPASDQTKGGGRSGVQRTPRFGAREQKIRSDKDTALSKLSPKDPKEFAKKFREWMGKPGE